MEHNDKIWARLCPKLQCQKIVKKMPQQDSKTNKQTSARLVLLAQLPPFPNNKYNKQQTQQQKSQTNLRQAGVVGATAPLSKQQIQQTTNTTTKKSNKPPPGWCCWRHCPPFQTTNTTNNKHNNNKVKQTSARLVLLAQLPPFPYRPREIFRPSTKYVRIRPFPFTCNVVMDFNIFGIDKNIYSKWLGAIGNIALNPCLSRGGGFKSFAKMLLMIINCQCKPWWPPSPSQHSLSLTESWLSCVKPGHQLFVL